MGPNRQAQARGRLAHPHVHLLLILDRPVFCPVCGEPLTQNNAWFFSGTAICKSCNDSTTVPLLWTIARLQEPEHVLNLVSQRGLLFYSPHHKDLRGMALAELDQYNYELEARRNRQAPRQPQP